MTRETTNREHELSRREFLATTGGAVAGAAALGLVGPVEAGKRHPKRGGTLKFGTRADARGLDPHRNTIYLVSMPLAATTMGLMDLGLMDLNLKSEPVPGIATEWDISKDLMTYTFKLRKGALFHNGREVDAAAVKWNYERIKNPKTSQPFTRSALTNLKEAVVVDKYTLRCHLHVASAAFPGNVVYYPTNLIAPDSAAQADTHPIGCGPFKFVKWERHNITVMERFENFYETDAEGNNLPYLDRIVGRPKREDRVRLTALRGGEVDLIDNMAYADAADFAKKYAGQYQTWDVPTLGTAYVNFNMTKGRPFADKRLRQAAAHAIDHEAIHQAVYYGRGDIARQHYSPLSSWHAPNAKPWPEYDPEKAKFLLRQAKAVGTRIEVMANNQYSYMQQNGELLQAMWSEVGFEARYNIYDPPVLRQKRRSGEFDAESQASSYRFDPDGWFGRHVLSTAPTTKNQTRFQNEKVDKLIAEAKRTADKQKRREIYGDVDSLVNEELPLVYLHHLTLLSAGVMNVKGYQPAISGPFSTTGAGIRTAWLA
jgi:peptide/nickel transport system substrate-binding protein